MRQNITNNYHRSIKLRPVFDQYYDFSLYNGKIYTEENFDTKLAIDIDYNSLKDKKLYSHSSWVDATNKGVTLYDIGLSAMDNGYISYRKDMISNQEFLDLLTGSTLELKENDNNFYLTRITGNTMDYIYPIEYNDDEKYISLKGGFYQGFFKIEGKCYEILPSKLDNELNINIKLRPRKDYVVEDGTMNDLHPNNNGFFFYIGTRAENKFYPFYDVDDDCLNKLVRKNTSNDGYMIDGDFVHTNVVHDQYMGDTGYESDECDLFFMDDYFNGKAEMVVCDCNMECNSVKCDYCDNYDRNDEYHDKSDKYFKDNKCEENANAECVDGNCKDGSKLAVNNFYENNIVSDSVDCCDGKSVSSNCSCGLSEMKRYDDPDDCLCESYFGDDYFDMQCNDTGNILPSEYIEEEVEIVPDKIYDSEGRNYTKKGYIEIKTDNKFILFNKTKTGFTVDNWDEETKEVLLTGRTDWDNYNYHMLMNRTKTGHTVNTINEYNESNRRKYNIYKDIINNALGFRIKDDGSIGYRYATYDCENEEKYGIIEEYSKPDMVKDNEWTNIHIKITPLGKKMKLMVYAGGKLVLISKELDKLDLRGLNDVNEKQECVPYNISLGGGTQGLLEAIYPDYYNQPQFIMPLERDFCGTFLGDIKSFKMYCGFLDYLSIKDYLSK